MQLNTKFPIGIDTQWVKPEKISIPNACLQNWLLDTGSLTERLQSQCRDLTLTLLGQAEMTPSQEESAKLRALSAQENSRWQVREILLSSQDIPWVFARSILPNALCQADLAELGNKPLGKILFNDERFVRAPFEVAQIASGSQIHSQLSLDSHRTLWARRSTFAYKQYHMMVAEVFLPQSPAYKTLRELMPC